MRRGQGSMISVPFLIACLQAETAGRIWMKRMMIAVLCLLLCGCQSVQEDTPRVSQTEDAPAQLVAEQILEGESGTIHYSYQLPEGYHETGSYPMMVVMPGYDMMWFGEDSSGANLDWQGFRCWSDLDEEMIVVSAQLTDWGETSARQAIELTEHFLDDFAVDAKRVYAVGYSAGGETMSRAVSMRPDLYAAYLHAASQWDGDLVSVTAHDVGVSFPANFYIILLCQLVIYATFSHTMFVSQMAFHARVSDPNIGGTYMTLLNTASNLGNYLFPLSSMPKTSDANFLKKIS